MPSKKGEAGECLVSGRTSARRKQADRLKRKPDLGNNRCTAPVRDQATRVGNEINAATRPRVWIPGKDKAVFFRQIGVVVAQIEVEDLVGEGHARLPVEIGG